MKQMETGTNCANGAAGGAEGRRKGLERGGFGEDGTDAYVYACRREKKRNRVSLQFNFSGVSTREDIHPHGKADSWSLLLRHSHPRNTPARNLAKVARNLAGFPSNVRTNIFLAPLSTTTPRPPRLFVARVKTPGPRVCRRRVNYFSGGVNKKRTRVPHLQRRVSLAVSQESLFRAPVGN